MKAISSSFYRNTREEEKQETPVNLSHPVTKNRPIDESVESAFVRDMKAALAHRLACSTDDDKRQAEAEMKTIMLRLNGRAWLERTQQQIDRKTAAAGGE